jgi:hypothetical protein
VHQPRPGLRVSLNDQELDILSTPPATQYRTAATHNLAPPSLTDEQSPEGERLDKEQVHQVYEDDQQRKPEEAVLQALHRVVVQLVAVRGDLHGINIGN